MVTETISRLLKTVKLNAMVRVLLLHARLVNISSIWGVGQRVGAKVSLAQEKVQQLYLKY